MKFSEAMLKGFAEVDGRQCTGAYSRRDAKGRLARCAIGAACAGGWSASTGGFIAAWGVSVYEANDEEGLPWEHIYGMAVAAGL